MDETITYVGLDVHKETIAVAFADGVGRGDARAFGQITNTPAALTRILAKLSQPGRTLKFCYEAGPCGYGIQRQLVLKETRSRETAPVMRMDKGEENEVGQ